MKRGADINAIDDVDRTPLMLAVIYNKLEMVKLLVELKANINAQDSRGRTALSLAMHTEIIIG